MFYLNTSSYSLNFSLYFSSISSVVTIVAGQTKKILRFPRIASTNYMILHKGIRTPGNCLEMASTCILILFFIVVFLNSPTVHKRASWHSYCIWAMSNLFVSSEGLVNKRTCVGDISKNIIRGSLAF